MTMKSAMLSFLLFIFITIIMREKVLGIEVAERHSKKHIQEWRSLEVVDGLKNEDVAVFMMGTGKNRGQVIRDRTTPAARTWVRGFANVYVVVEDSPLLRFSFRQCDLKDYANLTTFHCPGEPVFILTRKCTIPKFGWSGACCKVDDAITYLTHVRTELFSHIKYFLYGDDDTYYRPDQVMRWLASVEKAGLDNFPIIANNKEFLVDTHGGVWHVHECKEMISSGWYQPLMMNHAALELIKNASLVDAFTDTCKAFGVTHDVGFDIYAWLFEMYHIMMPRTDINGRHEGFPVFKPDLLAVHGMRINCDTQFIGNWTDKDRYRQRSATGCGDLGHPAPNHGDPMKHADCYDAYQYFKANGTDVTLDVPNVNGYVNATVILHPSTTTTTTTAIAATTTTMGHNRSLIKHVLSVEEISRVENGMFNGEPVTFRVMPRIRQVLGYKNTTHGKTHDIVKSWNTFTMDDCSPKGYIPTK